MTSTHSNVSYGLRLLYQKHLLPYEEHVTGVKAIVVDAPEEGEGACVPPEEDEEVKDAAEILEAMLGLGAGPAKPAAEDGAGPSAPPGKRPRGERRATQVRRAPAPRRPACAGPGN